MLPVCEYIILYIYLWNQIHLLFFQFSYRDWVLNTMVWLIIIWVMIFDSLPVLASTLSAVKTIGIFELSESFFNSRQNPYLWFSIIIFWLVSYESYESGFYVIIFWLRNWYVVS